MGREEREGGGGLKKGKGCVKVCVCGERACVRAWVFVLRAYECVCECVCVCVCVCVCLMPLRREVHVGAHPAARRFTRHFKTGFKTF